MSRSAPVKRVYAGMYKNLLSKAIGLYLFPFKPDTRLYHYVKDKFFTGSTEHLYSRMLAQLRSIEEREKRIHVKNLALHF